MYATKEDEQYIESSNHPDLKNTGPPHKMRASQSVVKRKCAAEANSSSEDLETTLDSSDEQPHEPANKQRRSRLSIFDVSEIAMQKGINTYTELLALANEQKQEGKMDLAEFILNREPKAVAEALSTGWEMEGAKQYYVPHGTLTEIYGRCLRMKGKEPGSSVPRKYWGGTEFLGKHLHWRSRNCLQKDEASFVICFSLDRLILRRPSCCSRLRQSSIHFAIQPLLRVHGLARSRPR